MFPIQRAILSVTDKTGLVDFARQLNPDLWNRSSRRQLEHRSAPATKWIAAYVAGRQHGAVEVAICVHGGAFTNSPSWGAS
jgi:hypothetical protein